MWLRMAFLFMVCCGPSHAEFKVEAQRYGLNKAEKLCESYIDKNMISEAVKTCMASAKNGDRTSMYHIGYMYSKGIGLTVDKYKAFQWYKRSAEKNQAIAQYNLAMFYDQGIGVGVDHKKSIMLVQLSANQKYGPALALLAGRHIQGLHVEKSMEKGLMYMKEAAYVGEPQSMYNYGLYLIQGKYGESNSKGVVWMYAALEMGLPPDDLTQEDLLSGYTQEIQQTIKESSTSLIEKVKSINARNLVKYM